MTLKLRPGVRFHTGRELASQDLVWNFNRLKDPKVNPIYANLVKPFAMPELTARVRALLRRSQAHGGPRIVHGPLALDTVARRAFLRNEPLELAAREWAVLEVLLGKVEKIVSKEAIIQAVAGWDEELSPNAIEVYISRLRSKLERAGVKIRTVRGFGYMLEEFKPN